MKMHVIPVMALVLSAAVGPSCRVESASPLAAPSTSNPPTQSQIDRLLAPVALYPDQLLAQILLCASSPAMVTDLSKWLAANQALKGTELQDAATVAGFEPSFVALVLFPQVVNSMATNLDWTTRLGKAFTTDRKAVFAGIQRLRAQAQNAGALKDTPQQDVQTQKTSEGETVIVIEPANPQIIYVPQYDPQVVYVPATTTVSSDAAVAGLIGFTAGIAIGAAVNNNYYYGPYGMHGGFHMYNDAWDDYYDHREDAREDWSEHRQDLAEERGDRARESQDQRTERAQGRQDTRTGSQEQRTERQQTRQQTGTATQARAQTATATQARGAGTVSDTARGYSGGTGRISPDRSGTRSDAFSGYSSGTSQRAASARGSSSRSSSRQGGGGGGRRR